MRNKPERTEVHHGHLSVIKALARELRENSGLKHHAALNAAAMKFGFESYQEARLHPHWLIGYPRIPKAVLIDSSPDFISNALKVPSARARMSLLRGSAGRPLPCKLHFYVSRVDQVESRPWLTMVVDESSGAILGFALST